MKLFAPALCLLLTSTAFAAPSHWPNNKFELVDGDRVVFLGNTLIERAQNYGYIETALTRRYPNRNIIFRNLGWSGDTVFGHARARFGDVAEGFRHLQKSIELTKPTVIILGYGSNASYKGQAGLKEFLDGLGVLLDTLGESKARIAVLSPIRHENLHPPLPDPAEWNRNRRLYRDALKKLAGERGFPFVDLYEELGDASQAQPRRQLTDNGIHLTGYGYWRAATAIERSLGLTEPAWQVRLDVKRDQVEAAGVTLSGVKKSAAAVRFTALDAMLPLSAPKRSGEAAPRVLRVTGLSNHTFVLRIDGKTVARATAREWAAGVALAQGPESKQAEALRKTIYAKNRLFFYRWRPQNETYLFLFRKGEQGNNAVEIPQFDPLVAQQEKLIAKLRVPVKHTYELLKEETK